MHPVRGMELSVVLEEGRVLLSSRSCGYYRGGLAPFSLFAIASGLRLRPRLSSHGSFRCLGLPLFSLSTGTRIPWCCSCLFPFPFVSPSFLFILIETLFSSCSIHRSKGTSNRIDGSLTTVGFITSIVKINTTSHEARTHTTERKSVRSWKGLQPKSER